MTDTAIDPNPHRLPRAVEDLIVNACSPTERDRAFRRDRLGFGDPQMRDAFLEALASPGIEVYADVCDDLPNEICVRACGPDLAGVYWGRLAIILLDPEWSDSERLNQRMAEAIAAWWEPLRAAAPHKAWGAWLARNAAHRTVAEIAAVADESILTVEAWLAGRASPSRERKADLAAALASRIALAA